MNLAAMDYRLFEKVNGWAAAVPALNPFMRFMANDAAYFFMLGMAVYWFWRFGAGKRRMVVQALAAACVGVAASGLIGLLWDRPRPFAAHAVHQLIAHPPDASFPSEHATLAFVIAVTVWLYRKGEGRLWLMAAALIALSRVWCGVHYPGDVLGGAVLGTLVAVSVHRGLMRLAVLRRLLNGAISIYEKMERSVRRA